MKIPKATERPNGEIVFDLGVFFQVSKNHILFSISKRKEKILLKDPGIHQIMKWVKEDLTEGGQNYQNQEELETLDIAEKLAEHHFPNLFRRKSGKLDKSA